MKLFNKKIRNFNDIIETITEEIMTNDYHDEDGYLPTINTIDDLSDFVECYESLNDDEWETFQSILKEVEFDGIDLIDEGIGGGAFSSEADYWRYRLDPNY